MSIRRQSAIATLVNWLAALIFMAIFFMVLHLVNEDADAAAKLDALDHQVLAAESRLQRAARALCREELGVGATARWLADGSLSCVEPRHATQLVTTGTQP